MTVVVVDTSLAVKWFYQEDDTDLANTLLRNWRNAGVVSLMPGFAVFEVGNAILQQLASRRTSIDTPVDNLAELARSGTSPDRTSTATASISARDHHPLIARPAADEAAAALRSGIVRQAADRRFRPRLDSRLARRVAAPADQ